MKIGQLIGVIVILGLLLLGASYALSEKKEAQRNHNVAGVGLPQFNDDDTAVVTTEIIHIVEYTESGFMPNSLILRVGESVRFENKTDNLMWVTHTDSLGCEDFDQCSPSSEFEYKFTEEGEWEFYNNLNGEHRGTITVGE